MKQLLKGPHLYIPSCYPPILPTLTLIPPFGGSSALELTSSMSCVSTCPMAPKRNLGTSSIRITLSSIMAMALPMQTRGPCMKAAKGLRVGGLAFEAAPPARVELIATRTPDGGVVLHNGRIHHTVVPLHSRTPWITTSSTASRGAWMAGHCTRSSSREKLLR